MYSDSVCARKRWKIALELNFVRHEHTKGRNSFTFYVKLIELRLNNFI
jgi:hypothetical protein